ncbi:MAG: hypothetical protein ACKO6N_06725 [Myxococcota bacterium]
MTPHTDHPWAAWLELAHYFQHCERHLPRLPSVEHRALALAELGHRHTHPHREPLASDLQQALRTCYRASPCVSLPAPQRVLLLYLTGAALGWRHTQTERAELLLQEALYLASFCWAGPSLEAPPLQWRPRRALQLHPEDQEHDELSVDPSGDPVSWTPPPQLEPVTRHPREHSAPLPIGQVLEGLNAWAFLVQQTLSWPLGQFSRAPRARLEAMSQSLPPPVHASAQLGIDLPSAVSHGAVA